MKRSLFTLFIFLFLKTLTANERKIWYFGYEEGLDFNSGNPVSINSTLGSYEGTACLSDSNGKFLFYTNGEKLYNSNHVLMVNGDSLLGDRSASQSSLIVPQPRNKNIYYVFTIEDGQGLMHGAQYSIVDLSLQNGLGEVVQKNTPIVKPTGEKITAIKHCNGVDIWIVIPVKGNEINCYLLTAQGLNPTPIVSKVTLFNYPENTSFGYLKASPDGRKLVQARMGLSVELFDFDNSTGNVSNAVILSTGLGAYGVEFSASSKSLYVSSWDLPGQSKKSGIIQYDLTQTSTQTLINTAVQLVNSDSILSCALLRGPDEKIYVKNLNNINNKEFLGVISKPDTKGFGCAYNQKLKSFGYKMLSLGLPNFWNYNDTDNPIYVPQIISSKNCLGDSTQFSIVNLSIFDSVKWNFGEPQSLTNNYSSLINPVHTFLSPDTFKITLIIYARCKNDTIIQKISITEPYELTIGNDTSICYGESIILYSSITATQYLWSNGNNNSFISVNTPGTYELKTDVNGCLNNSKVTIYNHRCDEEISLPNAFSPNADGLNDIFIVRYVIEPIRFNLKIFNKWGECVFETNNINYGWDGTFIGKTLNSGLYMYTLEAGFKEKKFSGKGNIYLIK